MNSLWNRRCVCGSEAFALLDGGAVYRCLKCRRLIVTEYATKGQMEFDFE